MLEGGGCRNPGSFDGGLTTANGAALAPSTMLRMVPSPALRRRNRRASAVRRLCAIRPALPIICESVSGCGPVPRQKKAAFGLLGEAAKAAVPYLQRTLAEQAVIDLKPFAADAKKHIAAAAAQFVDQARGVDTDITINDLRLLGIAFDDKNLRVITDAKGNVNVAISSLGWQ